MARRRMIDPKFWGDETIAKLELPERLFYIGLFSLADDEGRICGSPAFLRSQIYPYDDIPLDSVVTWIQHLTDLSLIHVYDDPSGNGSKYIDHPKWFKYQRIDNPAPSLLPPCPHFRSHWKKPRTILRKSKNGSKNDSKNDSRVKERKLKEVKGKEVLKEVKEERKGSKELKNLAPAEQIQKLARTFDASDRSPFEKDKEAAVKTFSIRFPGVKTNLYGLMHNILAGEREYSPLGPVDLDKLLKMIRLVPLDLKDPVARLTHIALNPNEYEVEA